MIYPTDLFTSEEMKEAVGKSNSTSAKDGTNS